jgi:hypothetical protein
MGNFERFDFHAWEHLPTPPILIIRISIAGMN